MNRLYVVEPAWTVTGTNADHRLRLRPSEIGPFTVQVAVELARLGVTLPPGVGEVLGRGAPSGSVAGTETFARVVARDLFDKRKDGHAVIVVGRRQPKEVHALVYVLNQALGAVG